MLHMTRNRVAHPLTTASLAAAGLLGALLPAEAAVDDEAVALLRDAVEQVGDAEQFEVTIKQTVDVTAPGMQSEQSTTYELAVDRPNRLSLRATEGMEKSTLVSDGETMSEYLGMFNRYIEYPAPADVNAIFTNDLDEHVMTASQVFSMVGPLLAPDQLAAYQNMLQEATLGEEEPIDGEPARHLRFVLQVGDEEAMDMGMGMGMGLDEAVEVPVDIWISEGETPTIRRFKPDLSQMHEQMAEEMPQMAEMDITIWYDFADWRLNEPIDDERFAFTAPEGAEQAASLEEAFESTAAEQQGGGGPGPQSLVGEPAPEFELELHEGGALKLEDHLGENIVILDFWATWCGPCVQAMPVLTEVAEQFADEGVVLYAVNQRETNDQVAQFLEDKPYDLTVPMDRQGKVAEQYHVRGIPQTVIIGKDGTVQAVHVGFGGGTKQQLERELQTLVDGGSLIDEE